MVNEIKTDKIEVVGVIQPLLDKNKSISVFMEYIVEKEENKNLMNEETEKRMNLLDIDSSLSKLLSSFIAIPTFRVFIFKNATIDKIVFPK